MRAQQQKTIVVALEPSQGSLKVFREALVLATSIRARVVAVSVTPGYEGNMHRMFLDDAETALSEPFRKILQQAEEYASSLGLSLTSLHRRGKPGEEIVAAAIEQHAHLIVIGCAPHHHLERMLSGRIVAEIQMGSPCDILLVPALTELTFPRILVGYDGSPASREAGRRAIAVARSYGSAIHALYAIDLPPERSLRYRVMQDAEEKASRILQEFRQEALAAGIEVTSVIRANAPERCLSDYARQRAISLIVMGVHPAVGLVDMLTGSVVERLTSLAPCPILLAKGPNNGEKQRKSQVSHCFA